MSRLMRMIGQNCPQHEACLRLFADWEKDAGVTSGVLPLRLDAALHALVLDKINTAWSRCIRKTQPRIRPCGARFWAPFNNTNNSFVSG